MKANATYDPAFYSENDAFSSKSAEIIVPLILDLVGPHSVIDVGCGTGIFCPFSGLITSMISQVSTGLGCMMNCS